MDVGLVIRERRQRAGLSQDALANAASTSQPTIAAYEAGRVVPSVPTLSRILESCGHSLAVEPSTTHVRWTRVEEKSLAIHRAIAARLLTTPMPVLAKAHHNLDTLRDSSLGHASQLLDEWDDLLNGPVDEIVTTLLAHGVYASDRSEALISFAMTRSAPSLTPPPLLLPGLEPTQRYRVVHLPLPGERRGMNLSMPAWQAEGVTLRGGLLGTTGLQLPALHPETAFLLHLQAE
jgi:transcriptional regulator with XRE-family HTH domain